MASSSLTTPPVPTIASLPVSSMASPVSTSVASFCSSRCCCPCRRMPRRLLTEKTFSATSCRSALPVCPVVDTSSLTTCSARFTARTCESVACGLRRSADDACVKSMILASRTRALPILPQLSWSLASFLRMSRPSRLNSRWS
uniref:Uncharacterized protein n=1 Tax=Arundo donax TaxID=35708 RepID=A0A0A9D0U1_ARUDO